MEKEGNMEGVLRERAECRRRGCVHSIGGEKNVEEGNVNEVTYLLISNELRLRVFNENV